MKSKKSQCECPDTGNFPLAGPGFSRRNFLRIGGTALVASYFSDVVNPNLLYGQTVYNPTLQNTAKNCVLVFLSGAPSHVDLWDLKEGPWTPARLEPTSYGEIRWPRGLMPRLADHLDKIALVRSGLSWAAEHGIGTMWAQIARNPSTPAGGLAPHIGAVVSLESQLRRRPEDILPGFVGMFGLRARAGYLPARYGPFSVRPDQDGLSALRHPDGVDRLRQRYDFLSASDAAGRAELGRNAADMGIFYEQAKFMMDSPAASGIFRWGSQDQIRYGNTNFAEGMIVARNLLQAKKGTRFVQVTYPGWDHHSNIYGAAGSSLVTMCPSLDRGLACFMEDLIATPGETPGKTMLDETLIVILAEFGRTVGPITGNGGRDHFLRMSYVFAGGGVKGGRAIGKTDALGSDAVEFGWSGNRDVRFEDVTATIYSALGIDYTTIRRDVPISRGFEYVPQARDGVYKPIDELFV